MKQLIPQFAYRCSGAAGVSVLRPTCCATAGLGGSWIELFCAVHSPVHGDCTSLLIHPVETHQIKVYVPTTDAAVAAVAFYFLLAFFIIFYSTRLGFWSMHHAFVCVCELTERTNGATLDLIDNLR